MLDSDDVQPFDFARDTEIAKRCHVPLKVVRFWIKNRIVGHMQFPGMAGYFVKRSDVDRLVESTTIRAIDWDGPSVIPSNDEMNVREFMQVHVEACEGRTVFRDLYRDYGAWCKASNTELLGPKKVGRILNTLGYRTFKCSNVTYKLGLRLLTKEEVRERANAVVTGQPSPAEPSESTETVD